MDLSSSTITSDRSEIDNEELLKDFLEPEYEKYYHVLVLEDAHDHAIQFAKITLEYLISVQCHDSFFVGILRRLNEEKRFYVAHDDNGLLIQTDSTNPQMLMPHSLKPSVLLINHYPGTALWRPKTLLSHQTTFLLPRPWRGLLSRSTQLRLICQGTHQFTS